MIDRFHKALYLAFTSLALLAIFMTIKPQVGFANYVENNLIDDNIFLNAASMSQSQIQSFLAARGGALANYTTWSGRDNATVSASQIIYEAAQDYGINPQVILATLQKEESLVTDPNPIDAQYKYAMGYGCPDSSACDSKYYGFYNQVDNGTWQFRFDFERARGNNSWWNSNLSYPCNGATVYYSKALLPGNNVTFYDDYGTAYKSFVLNDTATAVLYCYTPHVYPGSQAEYYSGSYNFVTSFEQWFGSTQPAVVISSPLRITAMKEGYYTNTPITVSFDITNQTASSVNIGGMAVAVRDSNNNNFDYDLQNMTVPAYGTITYSSTKTLSTEGVYKFWITNDLNGVWSDSYPVSSFIDNARQWNMFIQAMPTITTGPSSSVADMRQGKAANLSFTIRNNSQWPMTLGSTALAIRDPNGTNADLPLQAIGQLAAFSTYSYSGVFTPTITGSYNSFVVLTLDNGATWNQSTFPALASGVSRSLNFTVNPSPSITQAPTYSISSPRVGQQVTASFKVKNYGDQAVNLGKIGLAVRDPAGHNVDAGSVSLNLASNTEYTFSAPVTYTLPGTYTAWITDSRDGGQTWDDYSYPALEPGVSQRRITFNVLPNPTITAGPSFLPSSPRVGSTANSSFTIHNYGSSSVNLGAIALAIRDPNGRNVDCSLQNANLASGQDYVYNCSSIFTTAGTYTAWITDTLDGGQTWDNTTYPAVENSSVQRKITFNVLSNPTITVTPSISPTPSVGNQVSASFTLHNFGTSPLGVGGIALAIRDPNNRNVDCGLQNVTIGASQDYIYPCTKTFTTAGTYTAWITDTLDGGQTWDNTTYPAVENSSVQRKITFNVTP